MGRSARLSRNGTRALTIATAGLALLAAGVGAVQAQPGGGSDALVTNPASLVDPMIGTGSGGATVGQVDTSPGASAPFGMLSFSPDTPSRPDGGGYNYADSATTGFSLTHMSGPGCSAYGDFPILPTVGALGANPAATAQPISHTAESATPGAYSVRLDPSSSDSIQSDLAATARTGIADFTYPSTTAANVLFKMGDAQSGNTAADIEVVGDHEVTGTETAGQFCGSPGTYPVHFVATFDRPFASTGTWHTAPVDSNVFTTPTGQLNWSYHEVASGGSPATITPTTTSDGQSAIAWQQSSALANTWIETTPPTLTQGTSYEASVTLQGSGQVYLNFYNGQSDVGGKPVTLTSTPVTVTVDTTIPTGAIGAPQFQVRTPAAGAVNLVASAVSIRKEGVVTTPGSTKQVSHGPGRQRVPAATNGTPAPHGSATPSKGVEAKGTQSRTQVAGTTGLQSGAWVGFDTRSAHQVRMKVALSYVSTADAWNNLAREDPGWSVSGVAHSTHDEWNQLLDRIRIGGGTHSQQVQFYTAMYHAMLEPSIFSDADGDYLGFDDKVHRTRGGQIQYANFSGWDIYRSEIPLLATIVPEQTSQMMTSLLNDQAQGGWLPKWGFANDYTDVMNGDAADPMLAEAYTFGARDFDLRAALAAMVKGATVDPTPSQLGQGTYDERPQLSDYESLGYVPNTTQSSLSPVDNGASETLEYATADFAIAQVAKTLGDTKTYRTFLTRSQNWTNNFNVDSGYVQPRDATGQFPEGSPTTSGIGDFGQDGFQEGNAAQYTWMVPQNIQGLVTAIGGDAATDARLDTFFQFLQAGPDEPYEWAGNEPVFGAPWLYDYTGKPYQTQAIVHQLLTSVYADTPGGEPGNDDLGAMSSWYVWSSLGMYPETPGAPVLALGAPIFPRVQMNLPGGHDVTISAPGASTSTYVHGLRVDGRTSPAAWLPSSVLTGPTAGHAKSTDLAFTMGATPDTSWGTGPQDAPPSYPAGPLSFPPGRKPVILVPTGDNLLGDTPTGQLPWQGPVANGVGSVPGTITPATAPSGASAIHWTETDAAPNTWIYLDPAPRLAAGQSYEVSVTLEGTGDVYLDFYNGQADLTSMAVPLTATPQTLTLQGEIPTAADTPLQVRTSDSGPVDLYASATSIRLLTPQTGG
jgi:predicted alpha-1,2-mannosidase